MYKLLLTCIISNFCFVLFVSGKATNSIEFEQKCIKMHNVPSSIDTSIKQYYICMTGISKQKDMKEFINKVLSMKDIIDFRYGGIYMEYFYLKSKRPISANEFTSWVSKDCTVLVYGQTINDMKKAIALSKRGELIGE